MRHKSDKQIILIRTVTTTPLKTVVAVYGCNRLVYRGESLCTKCLSDRFTFCSTSDIGGTYCYKLLNIDREQMKKDIARALRYPSVWFEPRPDSIIICHHLARMGQYYVSEQSRE